MKQSGGRTSADSLADLSARRVSLELYYFSEKILTKILFSYVHNIHTHTHILIIYDSCSRNIIYNVCNSEREKRKEGKNRERERGRRRRTRMSNRDSLRLSDDSLVHCSHDDMFQHSQTRNALHVSNASRRCR